MFNVDVEAELGHVGSGANVDDIVNADHYTNVEQAVEFVERTGCGSLAVAVGNAHGAYVQTPNLDFARIQPRCGKRCPSRWCSTGARTSPTSSCRRACGWG